MYYPQWRLLTWHPRGLFDDQMADQVISLIEWEECIEDAQFNRFTDFSGLERLDLSIAHLFVIAAHRSEMAASVKSAFYSTTVVGLAFARMYEHLMKEAPIKVRAFKQLERAAEWLGVPVEILEAKG